MAVCIFVTEDSFMEVSTENPAYTRVSTSSRAAHEHTCRVNSSTRAQTACEYDAQSR